MKSLRFFQSPCKQGEYTFTHISMRRLLSEDVIRIIYDFANDFTTTFAFYSTCTFWRNEIVHHRNVRLRITELRYLWPGMHKFSFPTSWQLYRYLHALKRVQHNMKIEGYTDPLKYATERITYFPLLLLVRARFAYQTGEETPYSNNCKYALRANSYTFERMRRRIRCLA
jgi:hypothetical protein